MIGHFTITELCRHPSFGAFLIYEEGLCQRKHDRRIIRYLEKKIAPQF